MYIVLIVGIGIALYYFLKDKNVFSSKGNNNVSNNGYQTIDDRYNADKKAREAELNKLLDKVSKKGLEKLTAKEKKKLQDLSK